jgi:nucleotide-binding universal stress UspA family protein
MTMELKNILAATDFSANAGNAIERAALLARQHGMALHLIHVVPTISWKVFGRALVEHPLITEKHLYDAARAKLRELAEDCRRRHGLEASCFVDLGRPHERIANHAQQIRADLTVLGPHDESFAHGLFVGSTARKLLHTTIPLVLIAQVRADTPYRQVLAAVDFCAEAKLALQAALRLAPDAAIQAMHVYEVLFEGKMRYAGVEQNVIDRYREAEAAEAALQMHDLLDEIGAAARVQTIVRNGYPARALLDDAQVLRADLIVMGRRGRSEIDELFLGSVTEKILHDLDRDLLLASV